MIKRRLDIELFTRKIVNSRSQAESFIRLGKVYVNNRQIKKTGYPVGNDDKIDLKIEVQYVSRAALKLASVADSFGLHFKDSTVLDVGSSTGGFTDFALRNGAKKVVAVEVGSHQLHQSLRGDSRIDLREQTDIRNIKALKPAPDIVVIDVSFISLKDILPHVKKLSSDKTVIVAMVKPQFEATASGVKHKGIIKNEAMRREILKDFEHWAKNLFLIQDKKDSEVKGEKGNTERFYLLKPI